MQVGREYSIGLINRRLRRHNLMLHHRLDELFAAFCDNRAAEAFGELWASGEFDCGPQDYESIVKHCLAAVREYNERRTRPVPSTCWSFVDDLTDRDCGDESDHLN